MSWSRKIPVHIFNEQTPLQQCKGDFYKAILYAYRKKNRNISSVVYLILGLVITLPLNLKAQAQWVNVDVDFAPLPKDFHLFKTTDSLDGKPFIA